jgi:hypothetical protein
MPIRLALVALCFCFAVPARGDGPLRFERIVIDADFPGGYQVEVADVNGDKKPDIVALGGTTLAWYENPSWKKRIITTKTLPSEVISSATADLDGDGKAEIAVACDFAMNGPTRGKLLLAIQGATPNAPWTLKPIADIPSIHRLRWGDLDGDGRLDLVVAPLFGPKSKAPAYDQDDALIRFYATGPDPKAGEWRAHQTSVGSKILHAIEVRQLPGGRAGHASILTAELVGVRRIDVAPTVVHIVEAIPGATGPGRKRGSSEVHLGKLADGRPFLATIDPWHGSEVAVCVAQTPDRFEDFGPRTVIDSTLDEGHALWVADVDGDGNDEVFAGHRGKDARVSVYRFDGKAWARTVLDPALTAQDLRGGDLDGDGTPDVVAIGGKSHNVVWFRPIRGPSTP